MADTHTTGPRPARCVHLEPEGCCDGPGYCAHACGETADRPTRPPHEDPTLPPQLREALRIMAKRGPVVELDANVMLRGTGQPADDTAGGAR